MDGLTLHVKIKDPRAKANLTALRMSDVNVTEFIENFLKKLEITEPKTLELVA